MSAVDVRAEISLTRATFRALFGPILWAAHFSLVYATHTALCVMAPPGDAMPAASAAITLAALAAFGLFSLWLRNHAAIGAERFIDHVAAALIMLSALGVIWTGAASALIEPCAQLR